MLDNLADQKYLPVIISIHQNAISVTSSQNTYISHLKQTIHEYLYTNPVMIKIPIKD